jgi:hypothetical protein
MSGDVITTLDDSPVKDSRMLARKIGSMAPGTSVKLGVLHNGSEKTVTLTLGTLPDERQANAAPRGSSEDGTPRLGLTLAPANAVGAGNQGVSVTAVDPNGPAAEHGVQSGGDEETRAFTRHLTGHLLRTIRQAKLPQESVERRALPEGHCIVTVLVKAAQLPRVILADPHGNDRRFNACYQIGKARGLHHVLRRNRRRNPRERDGMIEASSRHQRSKAEASGGRQQGGAAGL